MTDWNKANLIPRDGLEAWHHFVPGNSFGHLISDHSGNDRHLEGDADNAPVLQPDLLNRQPGWYFDGTREPLNCSGAVTVRHLFILAAFEKAEFVGFEGLYGWANDSGGPDLLASNNSGFNFQNYTPDFGEMAYRNADIQYPLSSAKAPMNGVAGLIELVIPIGATLNGIQIGQQRDFADRKFNGWFFEAIAYSNIKGDFDRQMILEYFAMRYHVWPRSLFGPYRFPFIADRSRSLAVDLERYLSEPYEGPKKALIRGDFTDAFELPFAIRRREEYVAAEAFRKQHSALTPFVFRDERFIPARDRVCVFNSGINEQGSGVSHKFNYSLAASQLTGGTAPTVSIALENESSSSSSSSSSTTKESSSSSSGEFLGPFSIFADTSENTVFTQIYVDGEPYGVPLIGQEPEFTVLPADLGTGSHWIYAESYDQYGNRGVSNSLMVEIGFIDTEPPTAPTAISLEGVSDTVLTFTHAADSTDNVGVTGYEVRLALDPAGEWQTPIDIALAESSNVTALAADSNHQAQVRAYDAAGNRSEWSNIVYGASLEDIPEAFNVALASNGATASSSSTSIAGAASTAIDGIRHTSNNWGGGTGFASADSPSGGSPVTFEVDFGTSRTISGINLFFLASSVNYNTDPTLSDTSASYAANAFDVQYWNGSTWITIDSASGNTNVRKEFTFSPVVTTKARIRCTAAGSDGRLFLVEFEAWGY